MSPVKLTAEQKEARIMQEIRLNAVQFEPKFETTFFGNFFGLSFKSNTTN